jgi:membrane protease YdiL (CAAX protease family)
MVEASAGRVPRGAWAAAVAVVITALLAVAALASRARAPGAGESAPAQTPPDQILDYLTVVGLFMLPLGLVMVVWAIFLRRGQLIGTRQSGWRSTLRTVVVFAVLLTLAVVVVGQLNERGWRPRSNPDTNQPAPGTRAGGSQQARERDSRRDPGWLPYFVVGSVVLAFGVAVAGTAVLRRRRLSGLLPRQTGAAAAVVEALGDMIAELRAERDPRRAVIRAYSGMERTLGARGLPRHAYEAPFEYLERILAGVQASAHSVGRLTNLFERARFSEHTIDAQMKDEAIDALIALRGELEAAT